jgi:hypothetical protein
MVRIQDPLKKEKLLFLALHAMDNNHPRTALIVKTQEFIKIMKDWLKFLFRLLTKD